MSWLLLAAASIALVNLAAAQPAPRLNVSIAVFDPGVPGDASLHRDLQVFPRIRKIEAMFLPFVLRRTLVATRQWGAVRIVPEPDPAAELLVTGTLGRSDGETLELFIRAVDATGRVWVEQAFAAVVTDDYAARERDAGRVPGYQQLYDQIAAQLLAARERLADGDLQTISEVSLLRYGGQLAPSAFADYLDVAADGSVTLDRLPARDDPMLDRIKLVRETEFVITDAVDAKYREFGAEFAAIYDVWRAYRRKNVEYRAQDAARAQTTREVAPRGSFEALLNQYENYKFLRITSQEQDRLAVAFNNEVGPRITAMELRIGELQAWVDQKYAEWYRLLEALFEVETRLEP